MTLADLALNECAVVDHIDSSAFGEGLVLRLEAMGFIKNNPIRVTKKAIMNGPVKVRVGSTTDLAIRMSEASLVKIRRT